MNGAGYFIWQIETIRKQYTAEQLARLLKQAKTGWVLWKISDGIAAANQVGGNDKVLIEYMQALEDVGIQNGGWSYVYPTQPGPTGALISERVQKFQGNLEKFEPVLLDVEVEWKKAGLNTALDLLLASIDVNQKYSLGFCSYRFPKLHAPLNFARWLKNDKIKFNSPQVYWMGAHNVSSQLDESYTQYAAITDKPYIPMGAAWGQTVKIGGAGVYWEVTEDDLRAFVRRCQERGWNAYGFWSLDWILSHNKLNWLEAISGAQVDQPGPPPAPVPAVVTVTVSTANIRSAPVVADATDVGNTPRGAKWKVTGQVGEWWRVEGWLHKSTVK